MECSLSYSACNWYGQLSFSMEKGDHDVKLNWRSQWFCYMLCKNKIRAIYFCLNCVNSPPRLYLLKANNRNSSKRCKVFSKLAIKTAEQNHWCFSSAFIINFEHILYLFLSLHCWLWINKGSLRSLRVQTEAENGTKAITTILFLPWCQRKECFRKQWMT